MFNVAADEDEILKKICTEFAVCRPSKVGKISKSPKFGLNVT